MLTDMDRLAQEQSWDMLTMSDEDRNEILRSRVKAGIALLNEREWSEPWFMKINLDRLDIHSGQNCVLGQLFDTGDYSYSADGYAKGLHELGLTIGIGHGFSGNWSAQLTEIWTDEIRQLRENHVQ